MKNQVTSPAMTLKTSIATSICIQNRNQLTPRRGAAPGVAADIGADADADADADAGADAGADADADAEVGAPVRASPGGVESFGLVMSSTCSRVWLCVAARAAMVESVEPGRHDAASYGFPAI